MDFCSSWPEAHAKKIDYISSMISQRIQSTHRDPAKAKPHNDRGSFDEDFLDYVPEELEDQPDNLFNHLSPSHAATEPSMRFSAVLPMGGSTIASSSQPVPGSDSNRNGNDITNMTSIDNTGLVDGCTIVEGAMSLGG